MTHARRPSFPHAIERRYEARLLARCKAMHRVMLRELPAAVRGDAAEQSPVWGDLFRIVVSVRQAWQRLRPSQAEEGAVATMVRQLDLFGDRQLARQLPEDMVPRVSSYQFPGDRARAEQFVRDNVALIRSIDSRYFDDIEKLVFRAQEGGWMPRQFARELEQRFNVSQSRARLIARDQVGKLNGQLTEAKHRRLGITHYMWSTSGDSRVRETHEELDGQVFAYDDPPKVGHPGQDYQCRCSARPVMPGQDLDEARRKGEERRRRKAELAARRAAREAA